MLGVGAGLLTKDLSGSALAMLADGGAVPGAPVDGGTVPVHASPSAGQAIDDVPARLTPGEFVIPKDVMSWKGEEWAQKEIQKARQAQKGAVAKPQMAALPPQRPTFVSRSGGALPMG